MVLFNLSSHLYPKHQLKIQQFGKKYLLSGFQKYTHPAAMGELTQANDKHISYT